MAMIIRTANQQKKGGNSHPSCFINEFCIDTLDHNADDDDDAYGNGDDYEDNDGNDNLDSKHQI